MDMYSLHRAQKYSIIYQTKFTKTEPRSTSTHIIEVRTVTTKHEVCDRDKATIATVMKAGGYAPAASSWEELPCDIIHKAQGPSCPADGPPPLPAEDHAMVQRGS